MGGCPESAPRRGQCNETEADVIDHHPRGLWSVAQKRLSDSFDKDDPLIWSREPKAPDQVRRLIAEGQISSGEQSKLDNCIASVPI
jgi:hypothetical protein